MRIGILVVGLLLLGTLFVAASTLIRRHNPSPTPNPSPTSGQAFFTHSDPKYEYSIKRPEGWNTRNLTEANVNIALVVGPDPPYPVDDVIAVEFHPLEKYYAPTALVPFKEAILNQLGSNVNIVTQNPSPVISGLVGYYFVWTFPATNPKGLHAAYYLLDGDRYVTILLQVTPVDDTKSFENMLPIFQQMAQTFRSFHHAAAPTGTVTPAGSPKPTASPSH